MRVGKHKQAGKKCLNVNLKVWFKLRISVQIFAFVFPKSYWCKDIVCVYQWARYFIVFNK